MRLIRGIKGITPEHKGGLIAVGTFDGVHLGHQAIINALKRRSSQTGKKSIILTFDIHPMATVNPAKCPPLLTPAEEKIRLIGALGVDILVLARFDEKFANLSSGKFIKDILVDRMEAAEIFVGDNFTFGRGASGDATFLKESGSRYNFRVNVIPPVRMDGVTISSTRVRSLLANGKVREARLLLGRSYALYGRVVHGVDRGHTIGYPTANLKPHYEVVPADGVYVGRIRIRSKDFNGLLNIGTQPTFRRDTRRFIEAHVFDFDQQVYGEDVRVTFLERIRDEIAFESEGALARQIEKDVARAKGMLCKMVNL
jgi:riboflavin kinase/FMN adenylyltransferase